MPSLSRREFLRVSSLCAASAVAAACVQQPVPTGSPASEPGAPTSAPAPTAAAAAAPDGGEARFGEAPMLAELVAQGELPPVDERLPKNPYVTPVIEAVGRYGGTIRRGFKGVSDSWGPTKFKANNLTWFDPDTFVLVACFAESWEQNEEASAWTFHLREGAKWSDGTPFTSEAFAWYWQYHLQNGDITTAPPADLATGSPKVLATLDTPDDFTAVIRFSEPNPLFPFFVQGHSAQPFRPGHYMQQFHTDLAEDPAAVEAASREAGFDSWSQYYLDRDTWYLNPERPSIDAWVATNTLSAELFVMERNPYYYWVDEAGQQLPYVDQVTHRLFESADVFNMWIVGGEIDFQARHVDVANFTLYKESEEQGDYRVVMGIGGGHPFLMPNLTCKNARLREFFGDRKVRIAMSVAVNRDEINELLYDGQGTPSQWAPPPFSPNYYPKANTLYTEFDPDTANTLLDEAGYSERDDEGFRLHKDGSGETLSFIIEGKEVPGTPAEDAVQMCIKYLADVGIKAAYKAVERSLFEEHANANEYECGYDGGSGQLLPMVTPQYTVGGTTQGYLAWALYYNNPDDPNAEAPPEDSWIRQIWDIWERVRVEPDEAARHAMFEEILDIRAEECVWIGLLDQFPRPTILKNGLRNHVEGYPVDNVSKDEGLQNNETLFWEEA